MFSTIQFSQIGWRPSYTVMPCPDIASNALPTTLVDPCGTPFIAFVQDSYESQDMYYEISLHNQNHDSDFYGSQRYTEPLHVNQNTALYPNQPDSLLKPDVATATRQAKHVVECLPSHLRHQTSIDFKEDMLRNRQTNDNENTFLEWVYPPTKESPYRTFAEDTVQWGSDSMFDTESGGARRRVGVRQLTQFKLQLMPEEEEEEEEGEAGEEGDEKDEEEEQDGDADDARSMGSRSGQSRSPALFVRKGPIGRSRRNISKKAYRDSSAASAAGSSILKSEPKGQRKKLTIEQKRSNHIRHEKKRRGLIRDGFNDLTELVPELRGGTWSRSRILFKAVNFLKTLLEKNEALQEHLDAIKTGEQGL